MDREEGEMSDSSMVVDDIPKSKIVITEESFTVVYRPEKVGLVVEKLNKDDASKLEERAKRFGIDLSGNKVITQKQIEELYVNLGISASDERHVRFDTLHLKGVGGLTTVDIFEYLEEFKPVSLEWIDNMSCNVVCHDSISAALAILVHSHEIINYEIKKIAASTPPYFWREGFPHPKNDLILFRFATYSDKKGANVNVQRHTKPAENIDQMDIDGSSKNPWGDLCKSWGVYDHQEVFNPRLPPKYSTENLTDPVIRPRNKTLAKRLGVRRKTSTSEDSDSEWKKRVKRPRMRMHADDEEIKKKKKHTKTPSNIILSVKQEPADFPPLAIEITNTIEETHSASQANRLSEKFSSSLKKRLGSKPSVHSRLGGKNATDESGEEDSEVSDVEVMSKVQKVQNKSQKSSVWTRLDRNRTVNDTSKDLRHTLKSKPASNKSSQSSDLRKKIGSKTSRSRSPLRVEIFNDYYEDE